MAQYELGHCFLNGKGVPRSKKETVRWWRKAAEQNYASAQFNLAFMYYIGDGVRSNKDPSVKRQNRAEAARWLEKARSNGHERAPHVLSTMYVDAQNIINFSEWE